MPFRGRSVESGEGSAFAAGDHRSRHTGCSGYHSQRTGWDLTSLIVMMFFRDTDELPVFPVYGVDENCLDSPIDKLKLQV